MTKKMTVVFHDEELYTDLKIEAVRRNRPASEIIAEAVRDWLEAKEEEELLPEIDAAIAEYEEKGGRPWEEVEREWEEAIARREKVPMVADKKNVRR
jgi:predicted metal-dependent peptidase